MSVVQLFLGFRGTCIVIVSNVGLTGRYSHHAGYCVTIKVSNNSYACYSKDADVSVDEYSLMGL